MSNIGKNIKKLRALKKISQAEFAKKFNLARPSVGAYEEGRSEPKIDTIIEISKAYGLSVDLLLTKDLSINDLFHFDQLHQSLSHNVNPFEGRNEEVPLVTPDHEIEFLVNHNKTDFLNRLPRLRIPGMTNHNRMAFKLKKTYTFESFEYTSQDILIGKKEKINPKILNQLAVLHDDENLMFTKIKRLDDQWLYGFGNGFEDSPVIDTSKIKQLWLIDAIIHFNQTNKSNQSDRLSRLENQVEKMRERMEKLINKQIE
jgi:transcriptional regulator with XRE-family HTH domain